MQIRLNLEVAAAYKIVEIIVRAHLLKTTRKPDA